MKKLFLRAGKFALVDDLDFGWASKFKWHVLTAPRSRTCYAAPHDPAPHCGLDWATRQVAKRSGEVAAKEIARLEDTLKHKEKELRGVYEENSALRRSGRRFE